MSDKSRYVSTIQNKTNQIAQLGADLQAIFETYFDRGYNGGGADPIIDGDLAGLGVTAADVAAFITLAENFGKFLNNQSPFVSDYQATVNRIRTDI
jgi:hypothetical protein